MPILVCILAIDDRKTCPNRTTFCRWK